jgi:hypothetical protein
MKVLVIVILLFTFPISLLSQTLPEWFRVDTNDDSVIELNTNYVMFSNRKTERVRFRWLFDLPQKLNCKSKLTYKSILQEIEFDCSRSLFRTYETTWFDEDSKSVAHETKKDDSEWRLVNKVRIVRKLYPQACKLIDLRRRDPALEQ